MAIEIFADGEPVDPIKLQNLQTQISEISLKTEDAYSISTSTRDNLNDNVLYHIRAGSVTLPKGTKPGKASPIPIPTRWSEVYTNVYTVITPRLSNPSAFDITYSLSGTEVDTPTLNIVVGGKDATTYDIKFHWISAGEKSVPK